MTNDGTNGFDPEHLGRWLETTRRYLFMDVECLPTATCAVVDGCSATNGRGSRRKSVVESKGQLRRSAKQDE